jgi:hypothetical protein
MVTSVPSRLCQDGMVSSIETTLEQDIVARQRQIKSEGYGMSIGEVRNLYLNDEIDIHPSFQRFFRWTPSQKANLIESLLLGIPVPPIFVSTREDGVWDVVDGVQRLSTVLEFMGVLKRADGTTVDPEPLVEAEYLKSLSGVYFEAPLSDPEDDEKRLAFTPTLRRDFSRAKLEFRIIQKTSDPQAKYDLFQRLNSGARLTEQEARNSLAVMLDPSLYAWLDDLSNYPAFLDTVLISDRKIVNQYPTELVIRFLAGTVRQDGLAGMTDVASFLDDTVRQLANYDQVERERLGTVFRQTFDLLDETVGEATFRRWTGVKSTGGFNLGAFEMIAIGLSTNIDMWRDLNTSVVLEKMLTLTRAIWTDDVFLERSGSGKAGNYRMPALVARGAELFAK